MTSRQLVGVLSTVGLAATAHATVVNFDDLVGDGAVPAGYGGVSDWGSWLFYDDIQPPYNPASGAQRIYDVPGAPTLISFGGDRIFNGAYFAGFGVDDNTGAGNVHFELYNDSVLVWTSASLDPSDAPTFLASGYGGLVAPG